MFFAHIRTGENGLTYQTATEHCQNTAKYAGACLRSVGLEQTGILLGLVHDCGKFKKEFQEYLMASDGVRGSVNHTFAGTRLLLTRYHETDEVMEKLAAELVAFVVGSHHGLFDCVDENRNSGFLHRLNKENIGYSESIENFFAHCIPEEKLDTLFTEAVKELSRICQRLAEAQVDPSEYVFQLGLLARQLLSALIEGDRRDTAEFMIGQYSPLEPEDLGKFWGNYLTRMEEKLVRFSSDTPIGKTRQEISERCRRMAVEYGGIFHLNVPTGGGKTLSSLRYALAHAAKWGKKRLIFTSPLLSILEQNAAVIREFVEDDTIILEHHSNVLHTEEFGELDYRELAVENWNVPIIITTMVQLLNTMFDGKTTSVRRFQSLCDSVIVIDEVQTVPSRMLSMFNQAVDFLAKVCGATIVLCSATQPCLEKTDHPIRGEIRDLVSYDENLWAPFQRTIITDVGGKTIEEIFDFARQELKQSQSLLVVCNRKDEAEYLFSKLRDGVEAAFHLSASMCADHRRDTLNQLRAALVAGRKCVCVATQVIEAGVDISFHRVIRLAAGMDSVVQAAGRCNRNGESAEPVPVFVIPCLGEKLGKLREIEEGKKATISLLDEFRRMPQRFGNDLSSKTAIDTYYRKLYQGMKKEYQDYVIDKPRTTLFDLLTLNQKFYDSDTDCYGKFLINQAFKLAGKRFEVFDSCTRDLVVPYGKGTALIAELMGRENPTPAYLADWVHRARPYSIAVYEWQMNILGNAVTEHAGVAVLAEDFYDCDTGLVLRPVASDFLEV